MGPCERSRENPSGDGGRTFVAYGRAAIGAVVCAASPVRRRTDE
jgi:hypothetical protein